MTRSDVTPWSLTGRRAVVTGATSGIGLATAQELATLGAAVLLVARKQPDIDAAVEALSGEGRVAHGCAADLSTAEGRQAVRARVDALWGELHVLVNNVGMNIRAPTIDYPVESLRQLMSANVESAFGLCQLMHPLLRSSAPRAARSSTSPRSRAVRSSGPRRRRIR